MKIISDIDHFEKPSFSVVTIGTFDGIHIGHQTIIRQVVAEAKRNNGKSLLVTFWPHPRFVISQGRSDLRLISTFSEKAEIIGGLGIDYIIKLPFTKEFSELSAEEFLKKILIDRLGVKKLFIGYDHGFGNNREGNLEFLRSKEAQFGFEVNEIPRQDIDDIGVSSTKIRNALKEGKAQLAKSLLGRYYELTGTVIEGQKLGRKIGFPTANVKVEDDYKLLPGDGVYAVKVSLEGDMYHGMMNIGFKPTMAAKERSIEVHLFDFNNEIYGRKLTIEFVTFIRNEMKFNSLDELTEQLEKDKIKSISYLK